MTVQFWGIILVQFMLPRQLWHQIEITEKEFDSFYIPMRGITIEATKG